jgi:diguanylate cyclase (GGDEF)-like protein
VTRIVACIDSDADRRGLIMRAARAAGGDAIALAGLTALEPSRNAAVAIGAGEEGIEVLARLAVDRPLSPRIAVVDELPGLVEMLTLIDRVHPWAVITDATDSERLQAAVRSALTFVTTQTPADTARAISLRPPDFAKLILDPLTGIDGYHYFGLRLDEELERASRYARPLSLALIDVDELRALNDRHGHEAGDWVLRELAGAIIQGARAVDRVGRWAGGTFALVLPETPAGAAFGICERLRADLAARRFTATLDGGRTVDRLRITVSCGVACTIQENVSRPQTLVHRADVALWRAKHGGRNRSVVDG